MTMDWRLVREEVLGCLVDLIRINTANPPGNEADAAIYLQQVCHREGIDAVIYASASQRGNLVATLKGTGEARPLVLLSHLDVVGTNPYQWSHNPFAGDIDDGYVWGRGALDMKGMVAMELMALLLYRRGGIVPKRDLIWVAAADGEAGGELGMEWLIEQQIPGLAEAEFVINEGGIGTVWNGIPVYACQNGEKGVLWVKLTVPGTPGRASEPHPDNAISKMAGIIHKLIRVKPPMKLCTTTRNYLTRLARYKGLRIPADNDGRDISLKLFAGRYFKGDYSSRAMFYNTITPTVIRAGEKTNGLPECCEAILDCRLVPGETIEGFLEELHRQIDDPDVVLTIIQAVQPTESPLESELFYCIEEVIREERPGALVVPYLSPGGTDARIFRQRGITAYGFMPILISKGELQRIHGIDERISLDNLEEGTRVLYRLIEKLAVSL